MDIEHIIIFIFGIIIAFSIFFYFSRIHQSQKFNVYLQYLIASTIFFTVFALIFQTKSQKEQTVANGINFFTNLIKDFLDENINKFIAHPEMNYYYNQLLGLKNYGSYKRNKVLENQLSMLIFSRSASVLYYIMLNRRQKINEQMNKDLEGRFLNILDSFFQSPIFRENWYVYNKKLAGDPIRIYFKKHFSKYIKVEFPG